MTKKHIRKVIGENIRAERCSRNISMQELSEMMKLSENTVSSIERGRRGATTLSLYKLADLFNTSIDSFFTESSEFLAMREAPHDAKADKRKRIECLIKHKSEAELDFIIHILMGLRNHKPIRDGDYEEDYDDGSERVDFDD